MLLYNVHFEHIVPLPKISMAQCIRPGKIWYNVPDGFYLFSIDIVNQVNGKYSTINIWFILVDYIFGIKSTQCFKYITVIILEAIQLQAELLKVEAERLSQTRNFHSKPRPRTLSNVSVVFPFRGKY